MGALGAVSDGAGLLAGRLCWVGDLQSAQINLTKKKKIPRCFLWMFALGQLLQLSAFHKAARTLCGGVGL